MLSSGPQHPNDCLGRTSPPEGGICSCTHSRVFCISCNRDVCSIYPSFSEVDRVRADSPASQVIDDRYMRALSAASVTTFRRTLLRHSHPPITLACKYRTYNRQSSTFVMPEQEPQQQPAIEVPPGFTLHSENTTNILLPSDNGAFLNPVQEFNRDLSVACIRVWSEEWNRAKEARWKAAQEKKVKKPEKRLKGVHGDYPLPLQCQRTL